MPKSYFQGFTPGRSFREGQLVVEDYAFAADKTIGLAAFAHQPFDARSASYYMRKSN